MVTVNSTRFPRTWRCWNLEWSMHTKNRVSSDSTWSVSSSARHVPKNSGKCLPQVIHRIICFRFLQVTCYCFKSTWWRRPRRAWSDRLSRWPAHRCCRRRRLVNGLRWNRGSWRRRRRSAVNTPYTQLDQVERARTAWHDMRCDSHSSPISHHIALHHHHSITQLARR